MDNLLELRDRFIKNFIESGGFYDLMPYKDDALGFSIKRKLNEGDKENVSLIKFFIPKSELDKPKNKKKLNIGITYGKDIEGGVTIRSIEKSKISDPIDSVVDNIFYDIYTNRFFNAEKEVFPEGLLENIYNDHIKPTKVITGLWLRTKLFFWRIIMKNALGYISKAFSFCLWLGLGERYRFDPPLNEEIKDGVIISSDMSFRTGSTTKDKKRETVVFEKPSDDAVIFNVHVSKRVLMFYSVFHLFLYPTFNLQVQLCG